MANDIEEHGTFAALRLLLTKMQPPVVCSTVARPRLLDRLGQRPHHRLTLLHAPAGWGKTTLASLWLHAVSHVAWVSLDEGDNDAVRFWTYLFAALDRVQPATTADALAALRHPQPPSVATLLVSVLNALAVPAERLTLVLDDYHLITNAAIHVDLNLLLERAPANLHIVITSRMVPPLALARLRVQGQLLEISTAELRFDEDEASQLLKNLMHAPLTSHQVGALLARTEGWAAGLQLVGLALREHADYDAAIATIHGTHRYLFDYLCDEVLDHQSETIQAFLRDSSILSMLHGPLCDAVTEQSDSVVLLEHLARMNLFLMPCDTTQGGYRLHHLFRDVLRERLRQQSPTREPLLHQRAAAWYAAHHRVADAVPHALAANEWSLAASLLVQAAPMHTPCRD